MKTLITGLSLAVMISLFPASAGAGTFKMPVGGACETNALEGSTTCKSSNKAAFPDTFHKEYAYPRRIVVQHQKDWKAVTTGWTTTGDCMKAFERGAAHAGLMDAKAKYCSFHQKGWNAPKPKFIKGW